MTLLCPSIGELARRITPSDADTEQQRRLTLFALFAALALAFVRMDPANPVEDWIAGLREALYLPHRITASPPRFS